MDREILKDSKLFLLMLYIALRVKRSPKQNSNNLNGIQLEVGEFIIGRTSTVQEIDLTEAEYKTRLKKLQAYNIITDLQPTNKYTKGKWVENEFISVNLEYPIDHLNDQQQTNGLTTTNNINNPISSFVISFNKTVYPNSNYIKVINAYVKYKGIELRGNEIKNAFYAVKDIFDSQRAVEDIIQFMQWIKKHEGIEEYRWTSSWTIRTVGLKLPEYLGGKLKKTSTEDIFERY